ncbi:hypothetical protein [Nocardia wallacei]|uniref:hypothetical protein n=1 Tax=Nocardia wallacei TaxID=480035 RepID=UPI0024582D87|nr:hypothetical protein [Nocardia wallacei]
MQPVTWQNVPTAVFLSGGAEILSANLDGIRFAAPGPMPDTGTGEYIAMDKYLVYLGYESMPFGGEYLGPGVVGVGDIWACKVGTTMVRFLLEGGVEEHPLNPIYDPPAP